MSKNLTQEQIIEQFRKIHGNKYDYSKVNYIKKHSEVCIICPIHGEFWMQPNNHIVGKNNCPKCSKKYKWTTEEWIEEAKRIHGNKYDYSKVKYIDAHTKVCIICPEHGEFWQSPTNHTHLTQHRGCPKCNKGIKYTQDEWIELANKRHVGIYDYSKVNYKDSNAKVCIFCKKCNNEFWQLPNAHMAGQGCPHCKKSKIEIIVEKILNSKNILYFYEYRKFKWLKNKKLLELDFYLPDYNIAIECQGRQHFEERKWFGGIKQLNILQNNDRIKKELCEKNNLSLYYINYNDNVEEKMKEILSL